MIFISFLGLICANLCDLWILFLLFNLVYFVLVGLCPCGSVANYSCRFVFFNLICVNLRLPNEIFVALISSG